MVEMYKGFCKDYPVISIEDPFDQDDSDHTSKFTAEGVCQARVTVATADLDPEPWPSTLPPTLEDSDHPPMFTAEGVCQARQTSTLGFCNLSQTLTVPSLFINRP